MPGRNTKAERTEFRLRAILDVVGTIGIHLAKEDSIAALLIRVNAARIAGYVALVASDNGMDLSVETAEARIACLPEIEGATV